MNRHVFSLLAATVMLAPAAHAQATTPPTATDSGVAVHAHGNAKASDAHEQMMAKLNLTDAQKVQIKAIHEKYAAQMKSMSGMSGMSNMKGMAMPGMDKMRAQEMAEVRATLTPPQRTKFDAMMAEHQKEHQKQSQKDHGTMKMPMGSTPGMSH